MTYVTITTDCPTSSVSTTHEIGVDGRCMASMLVAQQTLEYWAGWPTSLSYETDLDHLNQEPLCKLPIFAS